MRAIFTVHAGEYLVAEEVEGLRKGLKVWVPSKDDGVDLLVTDARMKRMAAIQVKFSSDLYPGRDSRKIKGGIVSTGFFKFPAKQIRDSEADFWVLVLTSLFHKKTNFLILRPKDFYRRLKCIHGADKSPFLFIWVAEGGKCFEVRGLGMRELEDVGRGYFKHPKRDFSDVLNDWAPLLKMLQ
jgi:hypothetical protein